MQGLKVGDHDRHHGEDAVAVQHLVDEADHDHAGSGGGVQRRRPSPNNTSGSSGDTVSSSEWLHQQYCSDGGGGGGASVRVLALGLGLGLGPPPATPPPSLEMSLGRQGWQMVEQCGVGVGGEFESSPSAAKELTLLRCL
jgi:hypothetical protein